MAFSSAMLADVCSIYIYDEATNELVLKATKGLKPESVDNVRMKPGEGMVGMAMKDKVPVCEKCADENPYYKFYPNTNEELYEFTMGVAKGIVDKKTLSEFFANHVGWDVQFADAGIDARGVVIYIWAGFGHYFDNSDDAIPTELAV